MVVGVAPFVGREGELRELEQLVAGARSSRGGVVVLTGAAGIGKTRLADHLAGTAAGSLGVVWATCAPAGAMPPFWPWTQVLGQLLRVDGALARQASREWPTAASLAGGSHPEVDVAWRSDPEQVRAQLFEEVVSLLLAGAGRRPQLVVIDDLHDADASSWLLLAHLAPRLRSSPIAVVATWQTGGVRAVEPAAARLLRLTRVVAVPPLEVHDVALLVEAASGEAADTGVAAAVHRRTSGNPLLAHEVLAELGAHGRLQDPRAVDRVIPDSTRSLVADRLAQLPGPSRDAVAVAATIGRTFPLDLVAEVLGLEGVEVLDMLGDAVAAGALASLAATGGAFSHDVVRDALFGALPAATRTRLHRQVGEALERLRQRGRRVEPAELARHFLQAGSATSERAAAYARAAAERAMAMVAYEDAAAWFEQAVAATAAMADDPARRAELLIAVGEARDASGDRAGARRAYLEAAAEARQAERADLVADAALGMSGSIGFEVSLVDRPQIDLLREALSALAPQEAARRSSVMARLAVAVTYLEDEPGRARLAQDALELARQADDRRALTQALAARCDALSGPDHCATRTALAAEIVDVASTLREPRLELLGRRLLLVALLERGEVAAADREIRSFAAACATLGRPLYSWYVPLWQAMRALMEGRLDEVDARLADADRIGGQAESANATVLVGVLRWCLASELGLADEIDALMGAAHLESYPGVWPAVARALCTAQVGRIEEARLLLDGVAARVPSAEVDSEWLPMMAQVAELIGLVGRHPMAAWAYDTLLPYRSLFVVEGIGAVVRGSVERDLGLLAAALGRREEAGVHFDAAVVASQGLGATLLVARTLRDAGVSLDDRDRLRAARDTYAALGMDGRRAEIDAVLGGPPPKPTGDNVFRREGEIWRLAHAGREVQLRDAKGLRDLARLLAEPARPIAAVELAGAMVSRRTGSTPDDLHEQGDLGEVLDASARQAYRRRLAELDEEIDDADRAADPERSARAGAEKDALVAQLAAAYGIGGRPRRSGDPAERARQTVTARIRDAIARIEATHPDLGRHLQRSVRTGRVCVYEPDTPIGWSM